MESKVRLLRFFLLEIRDWVFAITALVVVTWASFAVRDWRLAVVILVGFVALYLFALFATSRLLGESSTKS